MAGGRAVRALEQDLADYLELRRSLGHEMAEARWLLPGFVAYLYAHGASTVTIKSALEWAEQKPTSQASTAGPRRMTVARGFARYLAGIYPGTEIPPLGLMPYRQRWRPPFIYSTADIEALMDQTRISVRSPLRAATYETLLGLLAAGGLRIGEAITLDRNDIDWSESLLLIRESKFGKSQLVPLHSTTMQALTAYGELRDEFEPRPEGPSFFVSQTHKRLSYAVVSQTFRQLINAAGIGAGAPSAPRLHDLRHTFAVRTLLRWYRTGEDVQAKLPWLSTYLGHREPASTYWYLSAAPELLSLAAARQDTDWTAVRS
ncbi:tyrosine-type recombinase/integrase [Pseudarthrobacter sp. HLT3-5]|uniref:tyrosine-type recombinase/integrase n=1 Tax=Pseudarthrobacter cellobiosi TaxID=2953654 RepID=UPI00208E4D33|nr:tyrosine-type recombinase/integrase [Pseudarthrobacter sp. HLT3-5]MCO4273284.1 tyrosine-type recombinase/integrase [Pseudarthrobacter sp. HLT3-5]